MTMTRSATECSAPRWLRLVLLVCLGLGISAGPTVAAPSRSADSPRQSTVLTAAFTDGILGNRTRMVQVTFIGFAIAVVILVTGVRKY